MSISLSVRRRRLVPVVFFSGLVLLVGGVIAIAIDQASIARSNAITPMTTLPVSAYTGVRFPAIVAPSELGYRLLPIFLVVAVLGLLVLGVAATLRVARVRASQS
jgi:hypothetical protein